MPTPIERAALEWLRRRDEFKRLDAIQYPTLRERLQKPDAGRLMEDAERALIARLRDVEEGQEQAEREQDVADAELRRTFAEGPDEC